MDIFFAVMLVVKSFLYICAVICPNIYKEWKRYKNSPRNSYVRAWRKDKAGYFPEDEMAAEGGKVLYHKNFL